MSASCGGKRLNVTSLKVCLWMNSPPKQGRRDRERMAEIDKMKKRREERAFEKAQHEEEMALLARERARAEIQDWEKKEEEFHFDQSKIRSEICLREGRTKPVDVLTRNLDPSDDFEIELNEPYMVFKGLTIKELEELHGDIKMHLDLDRATPTHIRYWEALVVVCEWELGEARKRDAIERARVCELPGERGLHVSIETDVTNLLQGKSYSEVEELQTQIESQLQSGAAKVVEYWEAVIKRVYIFKAKAYLNEIHAKIHLEERLESTPTEVENNKIESNARLDDAQVVSPIPPVIEEDDEEEEEESYSPQLLHADDENEVDAIDPEEDKAILERKRIAVFQQLASDNYKFEQSAMKAMGGINGGR